MEKICGDVVKTVSSHVDNDEMFELKDLCGKFSMDSIATCAFGVDAKSFDPDANSQFIKHAQAIFTRTKTDTLKFMFGILPLGRKIMGLLGNNDFLFVFIHRDMIFQGFSFHFQQLPSLRKKRLNFSWMLLMRLLK